MYTVRFVEDHELPEGHDWIIMRVEGAYVAAIKLSRMTSRVLEEAWLAYNYINSRSLLAR